MMIKCPCCQSELKEKVIYSKKNCPALNNVVYDTERDALNCAVGNIELTLCPKCNFVFNSDFNQELTLYDKSYDNSRIYSQLYNYYLDSLVGICSKGIDEKSKVLEIGCGNGDFLKKLCSATGAQGFGYDVSYQEEGNNSKKVTFFREHFDSLKSNDKFDVLILRHILEHIPEPYSFLKSICDNGVLSKMAKLWIEVPDLEWILDKGSFYDITYEHCNYFFKQTLVNLLSSIGFKVKSVKNVFDGQYILLEAEYTSKNETTEIETPVSPSAILSFIDRFSNNKRTYNDLIEKSESICIWGASGKGVIFLSELDKELLRKVEHVIDINPQKHEKFLPLSAKRVESPEILKSINSQSSVLVMNKVYEEEIKKKIEELGVNVQISTI